MTEKVGDDKCAGQGEYTREQVAKMEVDEGICINYIRGVRAQNQNLLPANKMC